MAAKFLTSPPFIFLAPYESHDFGAKPRGFQMFLSFICSARVFCPGARLPPMAYLHCSFERSNERYSVKSG